MARRLFYAQEWKSGKAFLRGETAEHLRRVLRAERGQLYELSDGERLWLARVEAFGRETVEFTLIEQLPAAREHAPIHLLASLFKFDHFEWMIEKATELGVERITPVVSLRSEKGLDRAAEKRRARWEKIAREAGQQCRRLRPPEIGGVIRLEDALKTAAESRLFLDEGEDAPPILSMLAQPAGSAALLCGPEGGWDPRERHAAREAGWQRVSLGPTILRAETAAVAAVAVILAARTAGPTANG
jgi:16S rRNA (uracil1498-N3)-methyltransferase